MNNSSNGFSSRVLCIVGGERWNCRELDDSSGEDDCELESGTAPCSWFYTNLARDARADDDHGVTSHWLRVAQRKSMFTTCFQGRVCASRS